MENEKANYDLVTKMSQILNLMREFEAGYSNPKKGVLIVNHNGENFLIEATSIGEGGLSEKMKEYSYIFN